MAKMIQEGNVLDLPNEGDSNTVSGALCYSLGLVGMWNEGGFKPGQDAPAIVKGVVEVFVTNGATAIERGDKVNLNLATMQLERAADGVDEDADGADDDLVYFGQVIGRGPRGNLLANASGNLWIRIKPQG